MTRKTAFFEGWFWFKFNNLVVALGMNLKFYTSVANRLKLLVGGDLFVLPILNRFKGKLMDLT